MSILMPAFGLVLVTFVVWCYMYATRIRHMRVNRIAPNTVSTRALGASALAPVAGPSDNLQNLFELPVLFYVLVILLFVTEQVSSGFVAAAWAFVALRALHSTIHCTYNEVLHRFTVYVLSAGVLWGMWAAFAIRLLR